MLYKKLFELSGLSNQQLVNKLGISHTERIQFEKRSNINVDRFVLFANKLGLDKKQVSQMVFDEILIKF